MKTKLCLQLNSYKAPCCPHWEHCIAIVPVLFKVCCICSAMPTYFVVATVTIVSNPAGTQDSGSNDTYDYPILSSVTLTCMATASDGSTPTAINYQWNTTGCYTNPAHNSGNPTCFPTNQTTQSVTGNNLTAEDAGTITCTATIGGVDYTSGPLTLRISGLSICYNMHVCSCCSSLLANHCMPHQRKEWHQSHNKN